MPTPAPEENRTFLGVLANLEDGQLAQDLTDGLHRLNLSLIKQAEQVGKSKGEIVLKLKFSVDGQSGTVQIDNDVSVKEPKPLRARTMQWMTKDGHLAGSNPKQMALGLKEVPKAGEPREAGADRAAQ